METLGLGEFARVAPAQRVHVFWIVCTRLSAAALARLGAYELNASDGLARE
jgi:hypothetical protein